ncbi:MAG: GTPase RsgA [Candidatus Omnitrophica bacterium]|nr:GTPase RsgA [Candidatus Omnitrophota bacterium]
MDRDYSLNRFERYITLAESENIKPVIAFNKTDLLSTAEISSGSQYLKIKQAQSNGY